MKKRTINAPYVCDLMLYAVLLLAGLLILAVGVFAPDKGIGFDTENAMQIESTWRITWGGQEIETTLPTAIQNPTGEVITMRTVLEPAELYSNSVLFYTSQSRVVVTMEGELLWDSGEAITTPLLFEQGAFWNVVRLPPKWAGRELCIELTPQFTQFSVANTIQPVFLGTKASFIYKVFKDGAFNIAFCAILFLLGMVEFFSGLFYIHHARAKQMMYLGAFAVSISVWMLLEGRVIQLVIGNLAVTTNLLHISYMLMPIFALRFFLTYERISEKKYMWVIFGVGLVLFAVVHIGRAFGWWYLFTVQPYLQAYMVVIIGGLVLCTLQSRRRVKQPNEKRLLYGIYMLLISTVLELFRFYFVSKSQSGVLLRAGLGIFVCYLGLSLAIEGRELRKNELEKKMLAAMAYTDGLTHMQNRLAFEQELTHMREKQNGSTAVLVADINDLKMINDQFGHTKGDEAIRQTAEILQHVFGDIATCYRIGGDEFCALAQDASMAQVETRRKRVEKELHALVTDHPFTISMGIGTGATKDIDEIFRSADEHMYVCKKEMKS